MVLPTSQNKREANKWIAAIIPFWTVGIWQDNCGFELPVTRSMEQSDMDGQVSWMKRVWSSVGRTMHIQDSGT